MSNNSHINIPTFEHLPYYSKRAKEKTDWIDIYLQARTTKEKAVTGGAIGAVTGLSTINVRAVIHVLRVKGRPICSAGKKGYWYATDPEEISDSIDGFTSRINSMTEAKTALIDTRRRMQLERNTQRYNNARKGKTGNNGNANQGGLFG